MTIVMVFQISKDSYCIYEVSKKDSDFLYIITGDLNARSGFIQDYVLDDNIDHLSDSNWYICDDFSVPRKSKDNVVNKFGRSVIDLCCNFNVHNVKWTYC